MAHDSELEKRVQARLAQLRKNEAEKRMLYDKTIGGADALRPSDKFIETHVGRPRPEAELRKQAIEQVRKERRTEMQEKIRREAVAESIKRHNARMEKRHEDPQTRASKEPEKMLDRVKKHLEEIKMRNEQQRQRDLDNDRNR